MKTDGIRQKSMSVHAMRPERHMGNETDEKEVLEDVLDTLLEEADGSQISVRDVLSAFDDRSFGALLTVIGLIAATPIIGAIPGISILCGLLVLLVAGQYVVGRSNPWIPSSLSDRAIDREKFERGLDRARPYAKWIDTFVRPRLSWLVGGQTQRRLIAVAACALALAMFPLALVPWGVLPAAAGVMAFGMAILGRDGIFACVAFGLVGLTIYVVSML